MLSVYSVCLLAACLCLANGHSYFSSISVDGVAMRENDCMRPHPGSKYDYPISDKNNVNGINSNDMTCGWLPSAAKAANRKCPVNPGSKITIQWHYEMGLGSSDDFIIDPSHKGPCIVYMAKSETGSGAVWFKIFEDGYNPTTKQWCVDKLRANKGKLEVTLPTDIAPGNYLFRSELIALHEGHLLGGAQPYVGCAELTVGGSGTVDPPNKVAIPGVYNKNDPGMFFNIYSGKTLNYPIPGPAVYKSGSAGTPTPTPPSTPVTTGKAGTSTTGRGSTSTTGRGSTSTTGRGSTSTTGRPSSSSTTGTAPITPPANPPSSSPCTLGEQRCASDSTFQTCGWASRTITGWSVEQRCPTGLSCHQVQGNYIWCY